MPPAKTRLAETAPPESRRHLLEPFEAFVAPGRRRTDNSLVVGTIVLCLGLITLSEIVQVTATFWAGSQVRLLMDAQGLRDAEQKARDEETRLMRASIVRASESQARAIQRMCFNTARTDEDKKDCLAIVPIIAPVGGKEGR